MLAVPEVTSKAGRPLVVAPEASVKPVMKDFLLSGVTAICVGVPTNAGKVAVRTVLETDGGQVGVGGVAGGGVIVGARSTQVDPAPMR